MVWVSNRGVSNISVSITNNSGGSAEAYTIVPQFAQNEGTGQNYWSRSKQETLSILRGGGLERQVLTVNPNDFVRVYSDAVIVSQADVLTP